MKISEFTLQKAILEVRYEPAYLHWDRAGSMWQTASQEWRGLEMSSAEPNRTVFKWKNMYEFSALVERANVNVLFPGSTLEDEGYKVFDKFIELVASALKISDFSRIGFRTIFQKPCESEKDASAQLLSLGLLKPPEGKHFGISGDITRLSFDARWEGEELGSRVQIFTQKEETDFDPPPGIDELKSVHTSKNLITYDVDYFTTASTSVGQFKPLKWIPPVMQIIRRDAKDFLGG